MYVLLGDLRHTGKGPARARAHTHIDTYTNTHTHATITAEGMHTQYLDTHMQAHAPIRTTQCPVSHAIKRLTRSTTKDSPVGLTFALKSTLKTDEALVLA